MPNYNMEPLNFFFPEPPWDEFDVLQMLKFDACQATIFFMKGHMGG